MVLVKRKIYSWKDSHNDLYNHIPGAKMEMRWSCPTRTSRIWKRTCCTTSPSAPALMTSRRCSGMSSMSAWEELLRGWRHLLVTLHSHYILWIAHLPEYMLTTLGYVLPTGTCLIDISERSHRWHHIQKYWINQQLWPTDILNWQYWQFILKNEHWGMRCTRLAPSSPSPTGWEFPRPGFCCTRSSSSCTTPGSRTRSSSGET